MSVITMCKPWNEMVGLLMQQPDSGTVVLGCDKCARTSRTGGAAEVREIKARLATTGLPLREAAGLVDAIEEGLCDPTAVARRLAPLLEVAGGFQMPVLSCGAGLKCVRDTLPGVLLVPGPNTLGPGVKSELACIACGDSGFGDGGCKMLRLAGELAARLRAGYETGSAAASGEPG